MKRFEEQNYYEMLEIAFDASSNEIDRAYKNAVAIYSEDSLLTYSLFTSDEREAILKKLEEAYNTLIDDTRRRYYDKRLRLCQTNYDNQEQMNIELIQPPEDNQFVAHSHYLTNKGQPNRVARTSDTEIGTNLLRNSVENLESRFMKKYLRQFLYLAVGIPVLLFFLTLVSYGELTVWNLAKQIPSTRSAANRPQINGRVYESSVQVRIPVKEKHALLKEKENVQEKSSGKAEPGAPRDNTSKIYINLASLANIRLNPDINSRIIMRIRRGKKLSVIGKTDEWLMLMLEDGAIGWIHCSLARRKELSTPISMVE